MPESTTTFSYEEKHYQVNNDIWFIEISEVLEILAILHHLSEDPLLKHPLNPYEARKICAIHLDLPIECVEEIDREYQTNSKIEINLKMYDALYYKIVFRNEKSNFSPYIKELEGQPLDNCLSEKDLQILAKMLKKSKYADFINQKWNHCFDSHNLSLGEGSRKRFSPVCMHNYIIKLWNYCADNGFDTPMLLQDIFSGRFPGEESYEILKNQLDKHGLFEEGWKRFDRILDGYEENELFKILMITCDENKICLPFKTTHNSYELDQKAVLLFWDQIFSKIDTKNKSQVKLQQNSNDLDGYAAAVVQKSQIIEILAIMEHLQLTKSNWSVMDRTKVCAIYQQNNEVFVAQLHSEFLIKKKIEMTFSLKRGEGGKLLFLSDKDYETVDNCSNSTTQCHQEVSPEEIRNVAETLKWSSYAEFLANYDTVSISD